MTFITSYEICIELCGLDGCESWRLNDWFITELPVP